MTGRYEVFVKGSRHLSFNATITECRMQFGISESEYNAYKDAVENGRWLQVKEDIDIKTNAILQEMSCCKWVPDRLKELMEIMNENMDVAFELMAYAEECGFRGMCV